MRFSAVAVPVGMPVGLMVGVVVGVLGFGTAAATADTVRNNYLLNCAGCHGLEGYGLPHNGIPDFHEAGQFVSTPKGRAYLVQVPGISQSHLDDTKITELLNWILSTYGGDSLPAQWDRFTLDEVTRLRVHKASDAAQVRRDLVAQH